MAGKQKHRERSRYRYHQQKPFVMFARKAYQKSTGPMMQKTHGGLMRRILRILKKNETAGAPKVEN